VDRGEPLVVEEVTMEHPRDDRLEEFEERMHQVEHEVIIRGTGIAIERILSSERKGRVEE
jgi:phosphoribosylglycinamide formyltransferase